MGKSCITMTHVRRPDGTIVESKLFNDLKEILGYQEAKFNYGVCTDKSFLEKYGDRFDYDENGEVKVSSLVKNGCIKLPNDTIDKLNKSIGEGNYDFNTAVQKMQSFNTQHELNDKYMATIEKTDDGKYHLNVVKKSYFEQKKLEDSMKNEILQNRLIWYLARQGVGVDFLKDKKYFNGKYDTANAEQSADGLYHLIQLCNGEHLTETLAEEAGHFAVGSLKDNPLVTRLMNALTPEVIQYLKTQKYKDVAVSNEEKREIAGKLVGEALNDSIDQNFAVYRLAHKIANFIRRAFLKTAAVVGKIIGSKEETIKAFQVKEDVIKAREMAEGIARGFVKAEGNIENALSTKEIRYEKPKTREEIAYETVLHDLNNLYQSLLALNQNVFTAAKGSLAEQVKFIIKDVEAGRAAIIGIGAFGQTVALEGVCEAIYKITDLYTQEIPQLLEEVDLQSDDTYDSKSFQTAYRLREVRNLVQHSFLLLDTLRDLNANYVTDKTTITVVDKKVTWTNSKNEQIRKNTIELEAKLKELANTAFDTLQTKEFIFYREFLATVYGKENVERTSRLMMDRGKSYFRKHEEINTREFITQHLKNLEYDGSWFETYLGSMANSNDIACSLIDKLVKNANGMAAKMSNSDYDWLRTMRQEFLDMGFKDTSILYERDDKGRLTGNLISEKNWGAWENARQEKMKELKEAFLQAHPNAALLGDMERSVMFDEFIRKPMAEWHKANSVLMPECTLWGEEVTEKNKNEKRYMPNSLYQNQQFKILMSENPELRNWYNRFMKFKINSIDARLEAGSTIPVRAPQFKGTFTSEMKQRIPFTKDNKIKNFIKTAISRWITEKFCESSEDTMFGSDLTTNDPNDELFPNQLDYNKDIIHRLPVYGVNKLKKMYQLSTDLFHSTLAYCDMANKFSTMNMIVHSCHVGMDVLNNRRIMSRSDKRLGRLATKGRQNFSLTVHGDVAEKDSPAGHSRSFTRYQKYLEKQVYGVTFKKHNIGKVCWEKSVSTLSTIASVVYLGGNIAGGMVNTGTGFIEMFKEGKAGEYYTEKDFIKANADYFNSIGILNPAVLIQNAIAFGANDKRVKNALFARYFNIRDENENRNRIWRTTHNWLYNAMDDILMLPYSSGDHYMQTVPFYAVGHNIKLYYADEKGNLQECDMIDSYEVVENVNQQNGVKAGLVFRQKNNTFYKTREAKEECDIILSILKKHKAPLAVGMGFTDEEMDYLHKNNLHLEQPDDIRKLKNKYNSLIWTEQDEIDFTNKCREINIRLHGIYNRIDKVVWHQHWFTNAFLSMKGWVLGMAERRFARSHYNAVLDKEVEGSLTTLMKVILSNPIKNKENAKLVAKSLRVVLLPPPLKKSTKVHLREQFQEMGLDYNQFCNLKRAHNDFLFIAVLSIARKLLANLCGAGDDDDDKDKAEWPYEDDRELGLTYYFVNRLFHEQAALILPYTGWYYESTTLLHMVPPAATVTVDMLKLGYKFGGAMLIDDPDSELYKDFYYQKKESIFDKGTPKYIKDLYRMTPVLKNARLWYRPKEGTKNFEFGRQNRS